MAKGDIYPSLHHTTFSCYPFYLWTKSHWPQFNFLHQPKVTYFSQNNERNAGLNAAARAHGLSKGNQVCDVCTNNFDIATSLVIKENSSRICCIINTNGGHPPPPPSLSHCSSHPGGLLEGLVHMCTGIYYLCTGWPSPGPQIKTSTRKILANKYHWCCCVVVVVVVYETMTGGDGQEGGIWGLWVKKSQDVRITGAHGMSHSHTHTADGWLDSQS